MSPLDDATRSFVGARRQGGTTQRLRRYFYLKGGADVKVLSSRAGGEAIQEPRL